MTSTHPLLPPTPAYTKDISQRNNKPHFTPNPLCSVVHLNNSQLGYYSSSKCFGGNPTETGGDGGRGGLVLGEWSCAAHSLFESFAITKEANKDDKLLQLLLAVASSVGRDSNLDTVIAIDSFWR